LVALTINVTAYASEIIRAGIESIRKGQIEAAESLGLTRLQILRDVILPPAIERVFPALTSQFVLMMLASSIMSQISAEELMAVAGRVQSETFRGFEIYLIVAAVYLVLAQLLRLTMRGVGLVAFPRRRRLGTPL
jgi:polar amino acid transport system permease protein